MALYQPVAQPQQFPQQQYTQLYMNNQGNINWNLIQYQQLLYAQQLYNNISYQNPYIIAVPTITQQPNNTNTSDGVLSLNASIISAGTPRSVQDHEPLYSPISPLNIDSMSPQTISSLLNAPEFIPTPKSDPDNQENRENQENQNDNLNNKLKLNAHCNEFLPGVTSWKKSTQLPVIKEDE